MSEQIITIDSRAEIAALNNLCVRLEVEAAAAGRSVQEEMETRTDLELAALFCGFQLAEELGKRGQDRQDVANDAVALVTAERPGLPAFDPKATANFRIQVSRWLGLD
ncbi:hypothetical protein EES39_38360 [Streptomyces sp. ADI92-24]|uniref:hypothetical protein n=1 Tax=Streptomyces sp. ADI92-24 TaxID=1522756 RepID=UPI000F551901|nr:hypothetical protein [Streptomyces sp. ADI92-24]RPK32667.1 hypothetical protein EES39_38360 [Streptomyces sp. ADI92-24]